MPRANTSKCAPFELVVVRTWASSVHIGTASVKCLRHRPPERRCWPPDSSSAQRAAHGVPNETLVEQILACFRNGHSPWASLVHVP
eukprot:2101499-Alexandrium_andersonii.AAC.1